MVNPQASQCGLSVPTGGQRRLPNRERAVLSSIVAGAFGVSAIDVCAPQRGRANVALARQTALYLSHVVLGMTLSGAGRLYGRDRTTAAHACRLVEDRRDEPGFDRLLSVLENTVRAQIADRAAGDIGGGAQ